MSNDNSGIEFFVTFMVALMVLVVGILLGITFQEKASRREAIAHNAAHYEVNPTTGETKFVWNNKAEDTQ